MILFREAISQIVSSAPILPTEEVRVDGSLGRVLSSELLSPEALPPFSNSAMDGFAVSAAKLEHLAPPFRLRVNGVIAAGDSISSIGTGVGECWEIMTGAPVPPDCNSVIKVEETERDGDYVSFSRRLTAGENIRAAGEDFQSDKPIMAIGTRVFPEHLMAFAALGIEKVSVFRKPRVSVISTGAELSSDATLEDGKIRNSTAPYLLSELNCLGVEPTFLGVIRDEPKEFLKLMESQLDKGVDVILCTGAVSMGRYDFVAASLRDLGAEILFHKVAIRPGKPLLFAKVGKTTLFGVPGNPISTAVGLRFFIEPYFRAIQRLSPETPQRAVLMNDSKKPEGLRCFFKAQTTEKGTSRSVSILGGQESFRIAPLLPSNAWAILPEEGNKVEKGSEIDVFPIHSWANKGGLL